MRKTIVNLEQFNNYSGNFDDDKDTILNKLMILESAEQVVKDYLGYNIIEENLVEDYVGTGSKKLFLHAQPVTYVNDVVVNGKHLVQDLDYIVIPDCIMLTKGKKFCNNDEIVVDYCAGLSADRVPAIIKETILRIATLMLIEAGENIGITSKSFGDNSRTFLNYTSYEKYLRPLAPLRIVRV